MVGPVTGSGRIVAAILAMAAANGIAWAVLTPPWQAPDEPKHFEYIRLLAEHDDLVAFETEADAADPELQAWILGAMDAAGFWWYGHAPGYDADARQPPPTFREAWEFGSHTAFYRSSPAYYAVAARLQPSDRATGLYAARLFGVALGVATVLFTALASAAMFPADPLVRYGAPALLAVSPMFAFTFGAVNSDTLANALAALTALLAVRLVVRGGSPSRLILLVLAAGAAVLVKRTAFFTLVVAAGAIVLWLVMRKRDPRRALVALAVGMGAIGLGFASWWTAGGFEKIPQEWRWTVQRYLFNEPDQLTRIGAYLSDASAWPFIGSYVWRVANGFWGVFGWESLRYPSAVYTLLALGAILAIVGLARRGAELHDHQKAALACLAVAPVAVAVGAAVFFASYLFLPYGPAPQSRYLMAAALPLAVLLTAGWGGLVPAQRRGRALVWLVGAMVVLDVATILVVLGPYFYGDWS
jgi:4-amino-4-deoxy-L-arabinose transferase-like glycosyltransferase